MPERCREFWRLIAIARVASAEGWNEIQMRLKTHFKTCEFCRDWMKAAEQNSLQQNHIED